MFGQLWVVEPEPELLELELEPDELPDVPVPLLADPLLPVLEEDDVPEPVAALDVPEVELEPELPVVDVVAALATSAPPARSPEVSAPTATALRSRMCMGICPFVSVLHRPVRTGTTHPAPRNLGSAQNDVGACEQFLDKRVTIYRRGGSVVTAGPLRAFRRVVARPHRTSR
jgi:hypothetical protein